MLNKFIALLCIAAASFVGYRVYETRDRAVIVHDVVAPPVAPAAIIEAPPVVSHKPAPEREHEPVRKRSKREPEPEKAKRGIATPAGETGPHVAYNCDTLRGYVEKYGINVVRSSAGMYGYSEADVNGAFKKCGIKE